MSLFLGKIHHWMFNKIQHFEDIEAAIIKWAEDKGLPVTEWTKQINSQYGKPTEKRPLEEVIDNDNIHGWLQGKIESAELRQAQLITEILKSNPGFKNDLLSIFEEKGRAAASQNGRAINTPEDVYNALNDFMLEGMPCDRVTEFLDSNDCEFTWQIVECLHKPHWDKVGGDVQNFHDLREAWVRGFINTIAPGFEYLRQPDSVHKIVKKGC